MPIFAFSENYSFRDLAAGELMLLRSLKPEARILDVGGSMGSWLEPNITHILDFNFPDTLNSNVNFLTGDINELETWLQFPDRYFDFVSCTHTLEDIRNPGLVVRQMSRIAKAGFISVPNRHQEISKIESPFFRGYCHHRWVFRVMDAELQAVAKWTPVSVPDGVFEDMLRILFKIRGYLPGDRFRGAWWTRPKLRASWLRSELAIRVPTSIELGLLWCGDVPFKYYNNDFAGRGLSQLMENINEFLCAPEGTIGSEVEKQKFFSDVRTELIKAFNL